MSDEENKDNSPVTTLKEFNQISENGDTQNLCSESTGPNDGNREVESTEREPLFTEDIMEKSNEKDPSTEGSDEEQTCSCWRSRYNWRHFLPCSCCCKSPNNTRLDNSGFLEYITASWASDVVIAGFKKALKPDDLGRLPKNESTYINYQRFSKFYESEKKRSKDGKVSLGKVFLRINRTKYIFTVFLLLVALGLQVFSAGYVLNNLLLFIQKPSGSIWIGIQWVILLILFQFGRSLLYSGLFLTMMRAGIAARAAVLSIIYNKLSRLKNVGSKSVGELVNLCANDAQRVFEAFQFGTFLIGAPFLVILISVYLYFIFGPSSLIGICVMILFLPMQAFLGKAIGIIRSKVINITDKRVKMINEVVTCIKLIKMYAWERSFSKVITDLRSKEKNFIAGALYIQAINMSMATLLTAIAPVVTFAAHIALGKDLTVPQAFTVIVMFNIFPPNIALLPMAVRGLFESMSAMKRLQNLLQLEEYAPHAEEPEDPNIALEMQHCNFSWVVPNNDETTEKGSQEENGASGHLNSKDNNAFEASERPTVKVQQPKKKKTLKKDLGLTPLNLNLHPTLHDIDLVVKKGSLIGICGGVGSGKSSFIQSILAQMQLTSGKVQVLKSIAYVSQQAWIMNDTIRNNITFCTEYDEKRYKQACTACGLDKDLTIFESGDLTEIGERGINLSGGQKQRISLARSLYADADLYLLDDPLSAVDANVGQHIFRHCIKKQMRGKTVIFVTHQLQYLRECDEVICMSDGRIEEHGTYTELVNAEKEFSQLIKKFLKETNEDMSKIDTDSATIDGRCSPSPVPLTRDEHTQAKIVFRKRRSSSTVSASGSGLEVEIQDPADVEEEETKKIEKGKIVAKEESAVGSVGWKVYHTLIKAGGGYFVSLFAVLLQLMVLAVASFVEWWLSEWLNKVQTPIFVQSLNTTTPVNLADHPDTSFYMNIYLSVGCSMFVIQMIASSIFVIIFIKSTTRLHRDVLSAILKSPMKFFDTTPSGRIINRFSRDIDELDGRLPWICETLIRNGAKCFVSLAFIAAIFPWFLVALVPLLAVFVFMNMIFRRTSRELKRLDNITRSPVFSHLTASVQGLTTLHAYKKVGNFVERFNVYVDANSNPLMLFFASNAWFQVRLDTLSIIITTITAIIALATKGAVPAAFAGLAITYSLRMTGMFQFVCRLASETEARFTSVERLSHYATNLEHEGPFESDKKPAIEWPSSGRIHFENVQLRYRPGLPLVLKDVTFSVNSNEKIGIAGRTGAGKSSLAVALFRLAELDGGRILIDDEDTSKIGLTDLRSKLSIIPQDPVLFIGTLRYNLDPFGKHTDEELWSAIEKAHIKDTISNLPLKLETAVIENGENFSVGERQLICMGRALLRESKILLLDEATAAIDAETDSKIQDTIREAFKDCTVLTIAHRLNTILESDKILIMDDGKVAEFDSPAELMSNPESLFSDMMRSSNLSNECKESQRLKE